MENKRSIFKRYFGICATMILMSITILGVVFLVFAAQYFKQDKIDMLEKNATYAAELTQQHCYSMDGTWRIMEKDSLLDSWVPMAKSMDGDIYLVNMSGETLLCSHRSACSHKVYSVPQEALDQVREEGVFTQVGKMGEIYRSSYYTVGVPLVVGGDKIAGVVFASASAEELTSFLSEILKMFLISALVVMVVAFILTYFVTNSLVRPLRDMLAATESFAKGDFTARVPVCDQDEIGRLAMAFNNMATSLAQQETVRRSFIANVSHELKTPMTTISGFAEGILDGTIPPERERDSLEIIVSETRRLSRLVRRMLDLSRLNALTENITAQEQFDLTETVSQVLVSLEGKITGRDLDVDVKMPDEPLKVWGDPDSVTQVCYNLLDNAAKFAAKGTTITVQITKKDGKAYTSIRNLGATIPPDELSLLFDRFHKADYSRSMDREGVGLGLYIVKTILGNLKENITVTSEDGVTNFTFTLTLA